MPNLPVRDRADAKLVGVCSALARLWAIDPLLVRMAFVVVALLTNGFALAVYFLLWAILPERGGVAPLHRLIPSSREWSWGTLATVVLVAAALAATLTGAGPGAFVILALAWLILRFGFAGRRPGSPTTRPTPPPHLPTTPFERSAQAWQQRLDNLAAGRPADWVAEPLPRREPATEVSRARMARRHGLRMWFGIAVGLGATWTGLAVAETSGIVISDLAWASATLLVLGLALLRGARPVRAVRGRPALLLPSAVIMALITLALLVPTQPAARPMSAVGVSMPMPVRDAVHLPIGEHTVDLSTRVVTDETLGYEMALGDLVVVVPREGNVVVRGTALLGDVRMPDGTGEGFGVEREWRRDADPDAPTLIIDVSVGLGEIEVRS